MSSDSWHRAFRGEIDRLGSASLLRSRRVVTPIDAVHVEIGGRRLINFASNDYLGLSHHPRVIAAMVDAAQQYGAGSGAAPLITGYTPAHERAEQAIAAWKGAEAAVLFSSGYQANVALVHALAECASRAGRETRFLLDKLCHASLVDAVRGVGAGKSFRIFPHNNIEKLRRMLARDADEPDARSRQPLDVILTESIFSMDGDAADLAAIAAAKRECAAETPLLVVDEAHGSGVYGPAGAGLAAELGLLTADVDATVVTLSKAIGVIGAAVCGSRQLCDVLVNLGRPYIYSTSMPAAVAAAATAAIQVMREEPHRQQRVRDLAKTVRAELACMGLEIPPGDSPIIPIVLGEESAALAAAEKLQEQGILALAIRPPTVAKGSSRLRLTLSCEHTDPEIDQLLSALRTLKKTCDILPLPPGEGRGEGARK
jgi:8-amino-7-oxononanoate synthase